MRVNKEVCVAMAVYNGSKFIIEQLDSLVNQTMLPQSVVIIDDCSTDGSFEIVQKYINNHNLDGWNVMRHEENKGYISTFWEAIRATKEKYIFLCDQDDIWLPDKIEAMYSAIKSQGDCLVLCSDFEPLYEPGACSVELINFPYDKVNGLYHFNNIRNLFGAIRPGCTYCINREVIKFSQEYSLDFEAHDAFFYRIALLSNGLYLLPKVTIKWRRHAYNASNRLIPYYKEIESRKKDEMIADRNLRFFDNVIRDDRKRKKLLSFNKYIHLRAEFFEYHDFEHWLKMLPLFHYTERVRVLFDDFQWIFKFARDNRDNKAKR